MHGRTMQITVKLFAHFRAGRFREAVRDYPVGTCIRDVLQTLDIAEDVPGIVLVNGTRGAPETELREGDILSLFPLVSGG
jgi:molybdopterin converting factor small subunit